jgi:hypothetical protein
MTGKLPKSESKWVFLNRKAEMLSNNSLKQPTDQFRLLGQKMPKLAILYRQNGKV